MCGIYCHIRRLASNLGDSHQKQQGQPSSSSSSSLPLPSSENEHGVPLELLNLLDRRGPDALDTISILEPDLRLSLVFTSSVLSLRGNHITRQPLVNKAVNTNSAHVLCWNGEAWRFNGREFLAHENDGDVIFNALVESEGNVIEVVEQIEGPFAFVFYDRPRHKLWFGRDWLGRRSLLTSKRDLNNGHLTLCSVSNGTSDHDWTEVEADGIYCIDLALIGESDDHTKMQHIPFLQDLCSDEQPFMSVPISSLNLAKPDVAPPFLTLESPSVSRLHDLLSASLRLRVRNVPDPDSDNNNTNCKIGILFSGGLDCTLLARLAHDILPLNEPVELYNVAFENKRVINGIANELKKAQKKEGKFEVAGVLEDSVSTQSLQAEKVSPYDLCPDRTTGLKSFEELQKVCPNRPWKLVKIDVSYEQVLAHRSRVLSLIYPHETEMDFSIGLAFYFAARPVDLGTNKNHSRILLSGLGADELFGGYARHGTAFSRDGFTGLLEELQLDLGRLGKRNLGRDDRVISNWGREARFPYLDEHLLKEVVGWRVEEKCDFGALCEEQSLTNELDTLDHEKKVLRLLAWRLGMEGVAKEKKRAIQFGARTAKMEVSGGSGKIRGTQKVKQTLGT